jgi:D-glycero-alpha-D-manno-heptose 1-phosphate guanylyltransferase
MHLTLKLQEIDVVILCGGLGTRLRGILNDRPKVMAEISGKPFLDILINYIKRFGFTRFILCVGYMGDVIKEYYRKKSSDIAILFSEEREPLGTAGAIKNAEKLIHGEMFLVLNGDSICKIDLEDFLRFHKSKRALLSIVLTTIESPIDYGVIRLDKDQKIISFSEKTSVHGLSLINAGIYLMNRSVLGDIPPCQRFSLEYDLFPKILDKGIYGYVTDERLLDIGTPERLELTRQMIS